MGTATNEPFLVEAVAKAICDTWAEREGSEDYSWEAVRFAHESPDKYPKLHRMYGTAIAEAEAAIAVVRALSPTEAPERP